MAAWAPFVALTLVLVVGVVVLARRSAALIRETPTPFSDSVDDEPEPASPSPALTPSVLLANLALTQGLLVAIVAGAILVFEIPWTAAGLAGSGPVGDASRGLGLGIVLWLGSEAAGHLAEVAGVAYDERLRDRLAPDSVAGWALLLVVVLPLVAAGEELLFRGALIGITAAGLGLSPWFLAGVSTVAFALGHGAQGRVGVVATGILGALLAVAFVLTGSLLLVVVAHYVINALEFVVHEAR